MKMCSKQEIAGAGHRRPRLPAELLEKVLLQIPAPKLLPVLTHARVRECLEGSLTILNSLCGTRGRPTGECIAMLRTGQRLRRAVAMTPVRPVTFRTGQSDMTQLLVAGDGIFTASDDGSIHRFSLRGKRMCTFAGHSGGVWALGISGNTLVTGGVDKMLIMWDAETGRKLRVLDRHRAIIRVLTIVDDSLVVTGSRDHTVAVWSLSGECLHLFTGHSQPVRCLDAAGDLVVSGSYDGTVKLWDARRGRFVRDICVHRHRVYTVRIGGGFVASAGLDNQVYICSFDGVLICKHSCHSSFVAWLDFEGQFLVSSGQDGTVVVYDCVGRSVVYIIQESSPIKCQRIDSGILVVGTLTELKAYVFATGRFLRRLVAANVICRVEIDGPRIVAGFCLDGDYQVSVFDYSAFT